MFTKLIYAPIGWFSLWIAHRNRNKIKEILSKKYDDSYENAGSDLFPTVLGAIAIIGIVLFLLGFFAPISRMNFANVDAHYGKDYYHEADAACYSDDHIIRFTILNHAKLPPTVTISFRCLYILRNFLVSFF